MKELYFKYSILFVIVFFSFQASAQLSCYNLVGYHTSWGPTTPAQLDYSRYTHIIYAFGIPNANGTVNPIENSARLVDLVTRGRANNTKVLLAIGGWLNSSPGNTPFESISTNPAAITQFVNTCANLVTQYNLDGIDIDWEYPTSTARWDALMIPLANRIHGMGKLFTAAVAGGPYFGVGFGNVGMLDLVNIMAYDCNCPTNAPYQFAVDAVNYWAGRGVPQNKRILGVPFYSTDNYTSLHVQKANYAKSNAGGIMIWEIGSPGDVAAIHNTLGNLCKGNTPPPPPCTAVNIPATLQAEAYCVMSGVQLEPTSDAGGGQNVGYIDTNDWMDYSVNVPSSGAYTINFRVASQPGGGQLQLRSGSTTLATVNIGATGGWQSWTTMSSTVNLSAGTRTLRLHASAGGFNVNWIQFTTSGGNNPPPTVSLTAPANGASYTAPATITITATASDVAPGTVTSVAFYNGNTLLSTDTSSPYSYTWTNVSAGTYSITARATDNQGATASASVNITVTGGSGGCGGVPQYVQNGGYVAGSRVQNVGSQYECKPHPFTGWCNGAAWAYAPGTGTYWQDAWILRGSCTARMATSVDDVTIAEASDSEDAKVVLYPNPGSAQGEHTVTLTFPTVPKQLKVSLRNVDGRELQVVEYKNLKGSVVTIPLSPLPGGMYILGIQTDKQSSVVKYFIR
jgi:hypothetical protein